MLNQENRRAAAVAAAAAAAVVVVVVVRLPKGVQRSTTPLGIFAQEEMMITIQVREREEVEVAVAVAVAGAGARMADGLFPVCELVFVTCFEGDIKAPPTRSAQVQVQVPMAPTQLLVVVLAHLLLFLFPLLPSWCPVRVVEMPTRPTRDTPCPFLRICCLP